MACEKFCRITVEVFELAGKKEKQIFKHSVIESGRVPVHLAQLELFTVAQSFITLPQPLTVSLHD
jgi:hypothetical protein